MFTLIILNMRTHNLTKTFNTTLFLSALACIALSINFLFLKDQNRNETMGTLIGLVESYNNDVRLKKRSQLNWEFVEKNKIPLAINDSVFTNTNSQVELRLQKTQNLTLKSESLLKIRNQEEILLQSGEIELNLKQNAKPLSLVLGNKKFKISANSDTSITIKNKNNDNSIFVSKGQVKLESEEKIVNLKENEIMALNAKELKPQLAGAKLIYPQGLIFLKRGELLYPKYKSDARVKSIILSREDKVFKLAPNEGISLRGDDYTYSLEFIDELLKSPEEKFTLIKEVDAPILGLPLNEKSYSIFEEEIEISFQWKNFNSKHQSEIQILDESRNIIQSYKLSQTQKKMSFNQPGRYSWRVRTIGDYIESSYSPERFFDFQRNEYTDAVALKIEIKRPNQLVKFDIQNPKGEEVIFKFSKDKDLKENVLTKKGNKDSFSINIPEIGTYYWKVESPSSNVKPRKIIITPTPAPTRAPKIKDLKLRLQQTKTRRKSLIEKIFNFLIPTAHAKSNELKIEWEKIDDAKIYEIEIFEKNSKKPIQSIKSKTNFIKWTPRSASTYYYRVRFIDYWDRPSPFSEKAKILVLRSRVINKKNLPSQTKNREEKRKVSVKKMTKKNSLIKQLGFFYSLQSLDSTQREDSDIEVQGISSTGHKVFIQTKDLKLKTSLSLSYQSQYGLVFDDQEFNQRAFEFGVMRSFGFFTVNLFFGLHQQSLYQGTDEDDIELDTLESTYSVGAKVLYALKVGNKMIFSPFIVISAQGVNERTLGISTEYKTDFNFSGLIEISSINREYTGLSSLIDYQSNQLLIGLSRFY